MLLPCERGIIPSASVVLLLVAGVVALGHGEGMDMDVGAIPITNTNVTLPNKPESYFQYGEHGSLLSAHILLMVVSWVFILPIGVLLSISRSSYALCAQLTFLVVNIMGILLVTVYNAKTPDFYPNNAHHKLGWILTWIIIAQVVMEVVSVYLRSKDGYTPVSTEAMVEHDRSSFRSTDPWRFSNDSGQGTEPKTESLRSHSLSSAGGSPDARDGNEEEEERLMHGDSLDTFFSKHVPRLLPLRTFKFFQLFSRVVDRVILILGFVAITTGITTYGGFFAGRQIFSGLAHFIKGGIFFWYGILTLGRWAGCFKEIGWAWNIAPSKVPSAEFVESFLIFFYGSTNVFLEHLAAWGEAWTAQDLEHISITIMFFGGGLCGMLVESKIIRGLLNTSIQSSQLEEPKSYTVSMNPIPALIVLLLGMMMSSHHQESVISTMIHKQWGTLLIGAAFARAATYVVLYINPPVSKLPGRPPTELITAFCLMAGGMLFMASAQDTVRAMEAHHFDAMFFYTVSMGVITFLMAWVIAVIAIKGAIMRKENRMVLTYD